MGSIKLNGATSGHVEISAPAVAGTQSIEFPTDIVLQENATATTVATVGDLSSLPANIKLAYVTGIETLFIYKDSDWVPVIPSPGRNVLHNSAFNVWQRGTSHNAAGGYKADRWYGYRASDAANGTIFQWPTSTGGMPAQSLIMQRNNGSSDTTRISVWQPLESVDSRPLAGKAVTLSYWAKHGPNYSAATKRISATLGTGTGTDQSYAVSGWTGLTYAIDTFQTITEAWTRYEHTATLASTVNQIYVRFDTDAFVGTAGANDDVRIAGVQLEEGSVATPFEYKSYADELTACRRYYWKTTQGYQGMAQCYTTTTAVLYVQHPVPMRTSAQLSVIGGASDYHIYNAGATPITNSSAPAHLTSSPNVHGITIVVASGLVAGNAGLVGSTGANGVFGFSAEL